MRNLIVKGALAALVCTISVCAYARADTPRRIDVPPGELATALELVSKKTGVELVFNPQQIKGIQTKGVSGTFSSQEAVRKLLEGTKLELKTDSTSGAMMIGAPASSSRAEVPGQPTDVAPKEPGKNNSSQDFRVAQVDQTPTRIQVANTNEEAPKKKADLEEIVVTGSRIPTAAKERAQEVKIYGREQIEQSGQTTVSDFLNTLPDVSISIGESSFQTQNGMTTVQFHGLPYGTTLVLINGRRTEVSALGDRNNGQDFFDLNDIPLAAVERVEVLPAGSSAVYGSQALGGIVNFILKKDFNGFEVSAKYGGATGMDETNINLAWGKQWDRGSLSIIGTYQDRTALMASERSRTSSGEVEPVCPLANIISLTGTNLPGTNAPYAAVAPNSTPQKYAATPGVLNQCPLLPYHSIIPATRREGALLQGDFELTPSVDLFTEILYSHDYVPSSGVPPLMFGVPGFSVYTVSASNPFNPYHEMVGVSQLLSSIGSSDVNTTTDYFRPLVGARGDFADAWHWEVAAWESTDRLLQDQTNNLDYGATQAALNATDPTQALNPFVAGAPGSPQLLQSLALDYRDRYGGTTRAANGFLRGPLFQLPAGPLNIVVGGEYDRDSEYYANIDNLSSPPGETSYHRESYAAFGEARVPIVSRKAYPNTGDILTATIAGRYDHYNDFGGKTTPQYGIEFRPLQTLLFRGSYAQAFKAPSLFNLFDPVSSVQDGVTDPLRGGQTETATIVSGGNMNLRPQTGRSTTFGVVYATETDPNLKLSLTNWRVNIDNSIQGLDVPTIINNPTLFPNNVIRASSCVGGPPCPITEVNTTFVNFGAIHVAGFDYQLTYDQTTRFGQITPSLTATQTYKYQYALTPGSPAINGVSVAQDSGNGTNWAPRWKGVAAVAWKLGPYSASLDGRYVGRYQDYDSTNEIGNFWLFDTSFRWSLGNSLASGNKWLKGTYLQIGGVNIFNRLPQYSNYSQGLIGYDPSQGDIRGRFLYVQMGASL